MRFWASGLSQEKVKVMKGNHHRSGAGVIEKKKTTYQGILTQNIIIKKIHQPKLKLQ